MKMFHLDALQLQIVFWSKNQNLCQFNDPYMSKYSIKLSIEFFKKVIKIFNPLLFSINLFEIYAMETYTFEHVYFELKFLKNYI